MSIAVNNNRRLTNLEILKFYKVVFLKKGLIKNSGSYILILIIIIYLISAFLFYRIEFNNFRNQIKEILETKDNSKNIKKNLEDEKIVKENIYDNSLSFNNKIRINNKNIYANKSDYQISFDLNQSKNSLKTIKKKIDKETKYNDYELNNILYLKAIENDKRTFLQYYISLLKTNHILLFTFCSNKDYNPFIIKICLFIFSIVSYLVINTLFFNDSVFHKIYEDKGKYNFIFILPRIIYSIIICSIINSIMKFIFLSNKNVLELKHENNNYNYNYRYIMTIKRLIIKYIFFFVSNILLCIFFWYYISCFCSVYRNSQKYLIINTIISFSFSLICGFIIFLIPGALRILALKNPGKFCFTIGLIMQKIV
jgi:hypothetical protein